eukprot:898297-Rhodomonas_salina.2
MQAVRVGLRAVQLELSLRLRKALYADAVLRDRFARALLDAAAGSMLRLVRVGSAVSSGCSYARRRQVWFCSMLTVMMMDACAGRHSSLVLFDAEEDDDDDGCRARVC